MIVTIGSTKGGVGKSTLAVNLAVTAVTRRKKVLLIDTDTQASSMGFMQLRKRDDLVVEELATPTLHKDIKSFEHFELIILDAGGQDSPTFKSAVAAADIFVIPVLPSVFDVWATSDTLEILKDLMVFKEDLVARFLINKVKQNTIMSKEIFSALKDLGGVPVLKAQVGSRAIFKNSLMSGEGVVEYDRNSIAAKEMFTLYNEIMTLGGVQP